MCYNISQKREAARLARKRGDFAEAEQLEREIEQFTGKPLFHASGFSHPEVLIYTNEQPNRLQAFSWGLVPAWVKTKEDALKIRNQTLNAKGETIFEKPSFRHSAKHKRCLIYLDAFYEHHHVKSKTYPFRIFHADHSPLVVAGLWEEWVDKSSGELLKTFTIVTTEGNALMSKIHNNPRADMGPRMPLILEPGSEQAWLDECRNETDIEKLRSLIKPYAGTLSAYPVARLAGKNAAPNTAAIELPVNYPELELELN